MSADYVIIQKSPFKVYNAPTTFQFSAVGFHVGSRSILSFVLGSIQGEDHKLKLRVKINGKIVYSYDSTIDIPGHWTVHKVVAINLVTASRVNRIAFSRLLTTGSPLASLAKISDVVWWGHEA